MEGLGALFKFITTLLPEEAQKELMSKLKNSETFEASPAGAILMGMYILEYVGFPRYVDKILGEEHTTIEQLKNLY